MRIFFKNVSSPTSHKNTGHLITNFNKVYINANSINMQIFHKMRYDICSKQSDQNFI